MISESTIFLAQPKLIMPIVVGVAAMADDLGMILEQAQ
jgi:hypothetical protein